MHLGIHSRQRVVLCVLVSVALALVTIAITLSVVFRDRERVWSNSRFLSARLTQLQSLCHGFPFKRIVNQRGQFVAAAIGAPFRDMNAQQRALTMRTNGVPLIGFCHYQSFPGSLAHNGFEDTFHMGQSLDYVWLMNAWGTCFRDPSRYGLHDPPRSPPMIDLVESDYAQPDATPQTTRDYDYVYVCLQDDWRACNDGWQVYCRNWLRAQHILDLVAQHGYRGLLVGRDLCKKHEMPAMLYATAERTGLMQQGEFWRHLARCRCLFVPNKFDASPRVIAEAIQLNVGVLVNQDILGGWKYVDETNGSFFDPASKNEEIAHQLIGLIERQKTNGFSHATFRSKYGRENTSRRLAAFLNPLLGRTDVTLSFA